MALLVCLAWPGALQAAPAADVADAAEQLLEQAMVRFNKGEFKEAGILLRQAPSRTTNPAVLAKVHLFLGLTAMAEGSSRQAEQDLQTALAFDLELELDAARFKPEFVALLQRVRQKVSGEIAVSAEPAAALVTIDGKQRGRAPFRGRFSIGSHQVDVFRPSGELVAHKVLVVKAGERSQLAVIVQRELPQAGSAAQHGAARPRGLAKRRVWTWVTGGVALLALGTAVGFSVAARSHYDEGCSIADPDGTRGCQPDPARTATGEEAARYEQARRALARDRLVANLGWGLTGALAATTALTWWLEGRSSRPSFSLWTAPGTAMGLRLQSAF